MINFFRKIRQQILTDNKPASPPPAGKPAGRFGKYLIYAVGEIILVVIGILIALSVNNWNQEKKDHRLGEDYLSRIHRDLVQDTINFRTIIVQNNNLREEIKGLLVSLYNGVDNIEQVQSMSDIFDRAMDQVFSANDNTYKGMISTGTLRLIHNVELKEEIIDLYSEYDQNRALLSSIGQWVITVTTTMDIETGFFKFGNGVIDIYTTPEMLNKNDYSFLNNKNDPRFKMVVKAISATAFNQNVHSAYYGELISRCDNVLKLINQELKK